jgi:hypothetical protein
MGQEKLPTWLRQSSSEAQRWHNKLLLTELDCHFVISQSTARSAAKALSGLVNSAVQSFSSPSLYLISVADACSGSSRSAQASWNEVTFPW